MSHAAGGGNTSGRALCGIGSGGWIGSFRAEVTGNAKRVGETFIFSGSGLSSRSNSGQRFDLRLGSSSFSASYRTR